jgi:hypothetical protein
LDQTYADDDAYEAAEPRRGRKMMMVLASAVVIGGGLAYAYSGLMGSGPDGAPPLVKSADGPFKVKPSDPGGKQFAHTDSKIMGRLGEGGASSEGSTSGDVDASGARKVPVLTVGRDGTIQAPPPSDGPRATVAVPGLTVIDGIGGPPMPRPTPAVAASPSRDAKSPEAKPVAIASADPKEPLVVNPPGSPKKPVVVSKATTTSAPDTTESISDLPERPDTAPSKPAKTAALSAVPATAATPAPSAAAAPQSSEPGSAAPSGSAGYVAVLASVPASASSRMDALKQFANMQEKYGSLLQDKTPDVKEADLGTKGTYHRLLVGPPGSRDAANALCVQLKAQGYSNCWVTAY